jgi:hypothetical protein
MKLKSRSKIINQQNNKNNYCATDDKHLSIEARLVTILSSVCPFGNKRSGIKNIIMQDSA